MSCTSEANIREGLDCGYYLWQVPGESPAVRLSLDLIDRLGSQTMAKLSDLTSRGAEIGGLLLGHTVDEPMRTVFVDSYELVECEYTNSARFSLSEAAKVRLVEALYAVRTSPRYARLNCSPVGFFRTHARKGFTLEEKDLALMHEYFPDPDSIFLLIKPFATKPSLGAIFVRSEGEFQSEPSGGHFPFKRAELAVRTPECIVGTTVVSNGASGKPQTTPGEPAPALAPGTEPALEMQQRRARQARGAEQKTDDDELDELKKTLRYILRNPAETKLLSSSAAEQDCTIWARIASLPGSESGYPSGSETITFGGARETAHVQETAKGLQERTPEPHLPTATVSAFENEDGVDALRKAFAGENRPQSKHFLVLAAIVVSVAGYFAIRSMEHQKPAGPPTPTQDSKLNLSFKRDGKGLVLHWDDTSEIIARAKEAILHIRDGNRSQDLTLAPNQLHSGTILYFPLSPTAQFQLEVLKADQSRTLGNWSQPTVPRPPTTQDKKARRSVPHSQTIAAAAKLRTGLPMPNDGAGGSNVVQGQLEANKANSVQGSDARNVRTPAKLVYSVVPTYPDAARLARAWGLVSVQGVVGTDGRVRSAVAVSGPAALRDAAVAALQHFVYQPATVGGRSTESLVEVEFNFVAAR